MKIKLFPFILSFVLVSCAQEVEEENPLEYADVKEQLMEKNKHWHNQELLDIDAYTKLHNWNVTITGTGLRYVIYKKADTSLACAKEGQIARVNYSISLLNDTLCYSSDGKPEEFLIGMDNVESGLHEGVSYMRKGEKAKIILSSNLAFGLIGDLEKVPPQSSLIYDIELVDVLDKTTKKSVYEHKAK